MRLFVAVDVGAQIAAAVTGLLEELRSRTQRLAPQARVTWISADRLHVTVRFIGHVDQLRAEAITAALDLPIPLSPFDLVVHGAGAFPPSGAPRVIWAGVSSGAGSLNEVAREVTARLAAAGVPPEDRPYRPHLTLARVRDAAGLKSRPLLDGLAHWPFGTTHVEAITLYESRLSPKGPTYVPLRRIALWKKS
jgi:2'-5' RNA ligase